MAIEGLIRIGMILAAGAPSMLCFGLSAYLLSQHVSQGWGWLLLIGLIGLDLPKKAIRRLTPFEVIQDETALVRKPEPIYQDFA